MTDASTRATTGREPNRAAGLRPQDPYRSFVVEASAGSGKTYQLSRRFLALVGAGAEPGSILTVTFTKKAAAEMRARILAEASRLRSSRQEQRRFDAELTGFHAAQAQTPADAGRRRPPLPAVEVGARILGASQSLRIATIDSLFLEWCGKFPVEAAEPLPGEQEAPGLADALVAPRLADSATSRVLDDAAWQALARLCGRLDDQEWLRELDALGFLQVREQMQALARQETFLWFAERSRATGLALVPFAGGEPLDEDDHADVNPVASLRAPLATIAAAIANDDKRERALRAIADGDLPELIAAALLTGKLTVHGNTVRGAKRAQLAAEIDTVESVLGAWERHRRLATLNRRGAAYYQLYAYYRALRDALKRSSGTIEFDDLAKGSFRIFKGLHGDGVRYLLARTIRHIMLDEFQDTSRLQWGVFSELALSLIAGAAGLEEDGGPSPSVFIVGDAKQSIYGFREADPAVMSEAADALAAYAARAPLTASWRSAGLILDFVNASFAGGRIADFPAHKTAQLDGAPVVPDAARVVVAPLVQAPDAALAGSGEPSRAIEDEARVLAALLKRALTGELPSPVWDKRAGGFRPLRPSDCVVLYRAAADAALFESELRAAGLPCRRYEEHGFFARMEIADVMALLRFLAVPADLAALCAVLKSPLLSLRDGELLQALAATEGEPQPTRALAILARLAASSASDRIRVLRDLLADTELRPHQLLAEALRRLDAARAYAVAYAGLAAEADTTGQSETASAAAADQIPAPPLPSPAWNEPRLFMSMQRGTPTAPPPVVASKSSTSSTFDGYGELCAAESGEAELARRNLRRLLELTARAEREVASTLPHVVRSLEALAEQDELGAVAERGEAISLMTIHKAKGLEFSLVALADTGRPFGRRERSWLQGADQDSRGLYYVGNATDRPSGDAAYDALLAEHEHAVALESERLLYVALTRAAQYLFATGHAPRRTVGLDTTIMHARLREAMDRLQAAPTPADASRLLYEMPVPLPPLETGAEPQALVCETPGLAALMGALPAKAVHEAVARWQPCADTTDTGSNDSGIAVPATVDAPGRPVDSGLPGELRMSTASEPHRSRRTTTSGFAALRLAVEADEHAAQFGEQVHAAIEATLRAGSTGDQVAIDQRLSGRPDIVAHVAVLLASATWRSLVDDALRLEVELPFILPRRESGELLSGRLDLLVHRPDGGLLVVDFKTTRFGRPLDADGSDRDDLLQLCQDRGYSRQLAVYVEAVRALYPKRAVTAAVLFTSLPHLLTLDS